MKLLKKAQMDGVGGVQAFIMGIVGVAVILAIGMVVLGELKDDTIANAGYTPYGANTTFVNATHYCASGTGWNTTDCTGGGSLSLIPEAFKTTGTIIDKLGSVPTWVGILITVALAFLVLGYFYMKQ